MTAVHATIVDRSPDTGSLVACTCGYALGPFHDHRRAVALAREHRAVHRERPAFAPTEEERLKINAYQRRLRAEKKRRPSGG